MNRARQNGRPPGRQSGSSASRDARWRAFVTKRSRGWTRAGPDATAAVVFSKADRRLPARWVGSFPDGDSLYILGDGMGVLARRMPDGYALTDMVSARDAEGLRQRAARGRGSPRMRQPLAERRVVRVNGGVPLFTILNSTPVKTESGRVKGVVPRYSVFDRAGRWITDPRYAREFTKNEKEQLLLPPPAPPICANDRLDLTNPQSCFVRDVSALLAPEFAQIREARQAGRSMCGTNAIKPHQQAIFKLAQAMATRTPEQLGGYRGLLCYHSVGSGKTALALGIMLAFWNSKRSIIVSTTPDNKKSNSAEVYAQNLFVFYPEWVTRVFRKPATALPPKPWTPASVKAWCKIKTNIAPLANRVTFESFTEFASLLGFKDPTGKKAYGKEFPPGRGLLTGGPVLKQDQSRKGVMVPNEHPDGSVLIMDEVQSLFTPEPKYAAVTGQLVPELTRDDVRRKMFVFALTATPGDTVPAILNVLNFVRPANAAPLTPADMSTPRKFAGLVSYVELRGDTSLYGTRRVQNIFVELSKHYYAAYLRDYVATSNPKRLSPTGFQYKQAKGIAFLRTQLKAGDHVPQSELTNGGLYSKQDVAAFLATRPIPYAVRMPTKDGRIGSSIQVLSDKLVAAIDVATKARGKQYIWVANDTTAKVVATVLSRMGFAQLTPQHARAPLGQPGLRFILYGGSSVQQDALRERFNHPMNTGGAHVKILVASGTFYQGLNLLALAGVHLVDTLFNAAADKQAVGRALRMCGHADAPIRNVAVYRYFAVPPRKWTAADVALDVRTAAQQRKIAALQPVHDRILKLFDPAILAKISRAGDYVPEGTNTTKPLPPGINTYVYADGARRQRDVERLENIMKAQAVDCVLYKSMYHANEPFTCAGSGAAAPRPSSPAVFRPPVLEPPGSRPRQPPRQKQKKWLQKRPRSAPQPGRPSPARPAQRPMLVPKWPTWTFTPARVQQSAAPSRSFLGLFRRRAQSARR